MERTMSDFKKGFFACVLVSVILFGMGFAIFIFREREKELIEYVEIQQAIEELREDYSGRDANDFLDNYSGVRDAADGAAAEFDQRLDEILQRFRDRLADR
jgi:hypothetical protein